MSYFGKLFKLEKEENFEAFVNTLGLPQELQSKFLNSKPEVKLEKNGDTYTLTAAIGQETKVITFKDGVEFDEKVLGGTHIVKTTFNFDGHTLNEIQKHEDGNVLTTRREFSDDKMIVTLTRTNWDGVARRYYKA